MPSALCTALICLCAAPPAGTLLTYRGEIVADDNDRIRKEVGCTALVTEVGEQGCTMLWMVTEKGQGTWPWIDQFGHLEVDSRGKIVEGQPASALFEHADGLSAVPLAPAIFNGPEELRNGANWRVERLQFEVASPDDKALAAKAWQINVATAIGHKRTMIVEKDRHVVTDIDETVFMGPGKEHRLRLTLTDEKQLTQQELEATQQAFDDLVALREQLKHETQGGRVQWTDEQRKTLKERLPEILKQASGTPVEDLALRAGAEMKLENAVAAATEKLRKQFVGQPVPKLELESARISGTHLSTTKAMDKPLVLHIWTYRDNPLVEPYGQIGYLDFLYRRYKEDGVQVYGIAVDERLDRSDTRSDAIRSVRKLQAFMNVGYPIVLGDRRVLERFGDPTTLGAELPLVIVVDGEGKITHYHLGLYEVDNQSGLAELDAAVKAVK